MKNVYLIQNPLTKSKNHYATTGGLRKTSKQVTITFKFPRFSSFKAIAWQVELDNGRLRELGYGMVIHRDLSQALKKIIDFEYQVIKKEDTSVPMDKNKLAN